MHITVIIMSCPFAAFIQNATSVYALDAWICQTAKPLHTPYTLHPKSWSCGYKYTSNLFVTIQCYKPCECQAKLWYNYSHTRRRQQRYLKYYTDAAGMYYSLQFPWNITRNPGLKWSRRILADLQTHPWCAVMSLQLINMIILLK